MDTAGAPGDRVTVTLHLLVELLDELADDLLRERHGVTLSQFVFLATLAGTDHPDVTTLARCLRVSKAAVSKRLGSFVAAGWIRTLGDPAHARRVVLELTPAATTLVDTAGRDLEEAFTATFAHVSDVDLSALHHDLNAVLAAVRGAVDARRDAAHDRPTP